MMKLKLMLMMMCLILSSAFASALPSMVNGTVNQDGLNIECRTNLETTSTTSVDGMYSIFCAGDEGTTTRIYVEGITDNKWNFTQGKMLSQKEINISYTKPSSGSSSSSRRSRSSSSSSSSGIIIARDNPLDYVQSMVASADNNTVSRSGSDNMTVVYEEPMGIEQVLSEPIVYEEPVVEKPVVEEPVFEEDDFFIVKLWKWFINLVVFWD